MFAALCCGEKNAIVLLPSGASIAASFVMAGLVALGLKTSGATALGVCVVLAPG